MRILYAVLFVMCLPMYPILWLMSRIEAERCPACGRKYHTELVGEWGLEQWTCQKCGAAWLVPPKGES